MWSIGIKSGVITLLGLMAYELVGQLIELQHPLWSNLSSVVLALGVYSGHYYYKAANGGVMSYGQGLKLGLIVVSFVGLTNALPVYLYSRFMDNTLTVQLQETVQKALQQMTIDESITAKALQLIHHMTPEFLCIGVLASTVLLGFSLTLIIAAFSKHSSKNTQP